MLRILGFLFVVFCFTACKPPVSQTDNRKIVVLTFDDAVKSHIDFVAPLLKEFGFGATFFISARWMQDTVNFMSWPDVGQLHRMGFEIGNHSWSHVDFSLPENVARLEGELGLIDLHLQWQDVPKPVSFAYCGNWFSPQAVEKLEQLGYRYARRGMQPEVPYGTIEPGQLYHPNEHHPLLIPSAGDAYPGWTLDHFKKVVDRAGNGKIAVLQFHGVPDLAHDWVTTDPKLFKECMQYLKTNDYQVVALRDVTTYIPQVTPKDSLLAYTHSSVTPDNHRLPVEIEATRESLDFWLTNMFVDHAYQVEEVQQVTGLPNATLLQASDSLMSTGNSTIKAESSASSKIKILPYPGGRHPRIGFLDGAFDPLRGTKLSVFLPDDPTQYLVVDLPEAIFSNLGLTFLAHRHFPTIWDYNFTFIDNSDWQINDDGSLENIWELPNGISFGAQAIPEVDKLEMELWLHNGTDQPIDSLKTQVCVMLKGASDFDLQSNDNKRFGPNTAAVKSSSSNSWVLTQWERTFNPWGNPPVPCMHADPQFESCAPGDTVRLRGKLWFYEGQEVDHLLN